MDVFAVVSGMASILGLGFSAWAVVEVRRLRRRYVHHLRIPQYADHLDDHASNLTALVGRIEADPHAADEEVARLRATVKSLSAQVSRGNRQEVSAVQSLIAQTQPVRHRQDVQAIRTAILGLSQYLKLLVKDDPWT